MAGEVVVNSFLPEISILGHPRQTGKRANYIENLTLGKERFQTIFGNSKNYFSLAAVWEEITA